MGTQVQGKQLLLANYGNTSVRAAAVLPATATTNFFQVVGGNVIITNILGQVVTATGATATTLLLEAFNTAANAAASIATAVSVASLPVGTFYAVPTVGSAGVTGATNALAVQNNEFIVGAGFIRATTSASNTGTVKWYVNYISLDPGAYVVAV
jgi:hypothetical protein